MRTQPQISMFRVPFGNIMVTSPMWKNFCMKSDAATFLATLERCFPSPQQKFEIYDADPDGGAFTYMDPVNGPRFYNFRGVTADGVRIDGICGDLVDRQSCPSMWGDMSPCKNLRVSIIEKGDASMFPAGTPMTDNIMGAGEVFWTP